MAVTRKSDVQIAVPQLWSARLLAEAEKMTTFHRFEGPEGSNMPVIRKDELIGQPGDTIKVDLVLALTNAGTDAARTSESTLLEGNEEKVVFRQMSFSPAILKHGVRWSKVSAIQITHSMRQTALAQLKKWLAGKLDNKVFAEFTGSGSTIPTQNLWFAGAATSIGTVTSALGVTLSDISDMKAYAKTQLLIEPMRGDNGEEVYGLILHPYAALTLKKDASYQTANREAQLRGSTNPLFTGAIASWDGVAIYEAPRVPTALDGTSGAQVARNIFFGAQALMRGYGYYPDWKEQVFSYGEEIGIATFTLVGQQASVFDFSAAGDGSGNRAVGHMIFYSAAPAPVA